MVVQAICSRAQSLVPLLVPMRCFVTGCFVTGFCFISGLLTVCERVCAGLLINQAAATALCGVKQFPVNWKGLFDTTGA